MAEEYYKISFLNPSSAHLFIHILKSEAEPMGQKKIPQVVILLESPSFYIKATYALIRGNNEEWDKIIKDRWNKILSWCPRIK